MVLRSVTFSQVSIAKATSLVALLISSDGAIYISDDYAGAIYRLKYEGVQADTDGLTVATQSKLDKSPPAWLDGADLPAMSDRGSQLVQRYGCQACHGDQTGQVSFSRLSERLGYDAVIEALKQPRANMPLYPLSENEQREIAVYLLSQ